MAYPDLIQANAVMDAVLREDIQDPRAVTARREGLRLCREYATNPRNVYLDIHFPNELWGFAEILCERLNAAAAPNSEPWASVAPSDAAHVALSLRVALTAPEAVLDHLQATLDLEEQMAGALTNLKGALNDLKASNSATTVGLDELPLSE